MEESKDNFCFVRSSDLHTKIKIKIGTLQGNKKKVDYKMLLDQPMLKFSGMYQKECADLMIVCQVFAGGQPITLPVRTSYKAFTNRWNWNETLTLPIFFSDLPQDAQLALTIYDCAGPSCMYAVGGTTISLFGKHGSFREGMYDLKVWPDREADGNFPSTTSGKECDNGKRQKQRLSKLAKEHSVNNIKNVDWLDRLVFREIHLINEKEKRVSNCMYLMLEFPKVVFKEVSYTVVFHEENKDISQYPVRTERGIVTMPDYEILQENLVESKHHKLARSVRSGISDKDAKPNANLRDVLNTIIAYPPTKQLSAEEQDLVWKYRFYLSKEKKALTKFLKCVNWKVCSEATHALDVLKIWTPMDVEDALELLGPTFSYPLVRHYAVTRLQQAPDEDLLLYLLQLVQALKYENFDKIKEAYRKLCPDHSAPDVTDSWSKENKESIDLIMKKSHSCSTNGSADVEEASGTLETHCNSFEGQMSENDKLPQHSTNEFNECDLATFLIQRACENSILANYFYWYLLIECEDQEPAVKQDTKVRNMYLTVLKTFSQSLLKGNAEWQKRRIFLYRQLSFIDKLVKLIKTVARESGSRLKKTERLQALLANSEDFKINFANFEPLPFPLDPDVVIKGIVPEKASLFKSALMPSRLTFLTTDNTEYVAIFKNGDDLRQDQLILQMITLMDKLLRRENLDLKLTPYRVLATSTRHGFVQFIDSLPVQEILTAEGSILNFFRKHNPSETGPYGIAPEVMDTYVKSCAGYCVITYLLGVGDRHLENLLLTTSGKLFHIDFGYILGRDPKPLPPPMKLTKEMVEAMGGVQAEHYHIFRQQCYTAFLHLRRHANLMLNLFSLMVDASVPDIALEPDKAVKKVQDKLRLDLCDEEAVQCIHTLLDDSTSAVMPVLVEQLHKFTQYLRK